MRALAVGVVLLTGCNFASALDTYCMAGHPGCENICPADGGPCLLAGGIHLSSFLTVGNGNVYWSTGSKGGGIFEVPVRGGDTTPLKTGLEIPGGIGVDEHTVFWASRLVKTGSIDTISLDDQSSHVFATDVDSPCDVAVTATDIYWSESRSDAGNGVFKASRTSNDVMQIGSPTTLTCRITVTDDAIYWTDATADGTIWQAQLDGTQATTVALHQNFPRQAVADTQNVYWVESGLGGNVKRMSKDTHTIDTLADVQTNPNDLATDGVWVYWTNFDDQLGAVMRVPVGGSSDDAETVVDMNNAAAIRLDADSVYWVTYTTDGGVYRASK